MEKLTPPQYWSVAEALARLQQHLEQVERSGEPHQGALKDALRNTIETLNKQLEALK